MQDTLSNDNKYAIGSFVYAKDFPEQKLVVDAYKQRIYFCTIPDQPEAKRFAYFESELLPPKV
jgi:hypothetical protein